MAKSLRYILISLFIVSFSADARMYQWNDTDTGTTQFSGKPPTWYRTDERGPRTFVFESGQLVDDTGIKVSAEHQELLRQRSYDIANEESIRDKAKSILAKRDRRVVSEDEALEESAADELAASEKTEDEIPDDPAEKSMEDLSGLELEEMKKLILDWESFQEKRAKEIINQ